MYLCRPVCIVFVFVLLYLSIHQELRTVGNMFIFNLAIADMAVTLFANVFNIVGMYIVCK